MRLPTGRTCRFASATGKKYHSEVKKIDTETYRDILENIILRQIGENRDLNLLFTDLENEIRIDDTFREKFLSIKQENDLDIRRIVRSAARATVHHLYDVNQYIQPADRDIADLEDIYISTFDTISRENFTETMKKHLLMIRAWLIRFYSQEFVDALKRNSRIGKAVNREYSASFQINLFDLDPQNLREPVLDIGCGKNALLVADLMNRGLDVLGIDRITDSSIGCVRETGWFDFSFEKNYWGTIVANMSFTNHLLFCLKNQSNMLRDYYEGYKRILESMQTGGSFYYAPSVDFIENMLDRKKYAVYKKIVGGVGVSRIERRE